MSTLRRNSQVCSHMQSSNINQITNAHILQSSNAISENLFYKYTCICARQSKFLSLGHWLSKIRCSHKKKFCRIEDIKEVLYFDIETFPSRLKKKTSAKDCISQSIFRVSSRQIKISLFLASTYINSEGYIKKKKNLQKDTQKTLKSSGYLCERELGICKRKREGEFSLCAFSVCVYIRVGGGV